MIYKYCRRCGRRLKGEENRARGYGETCFLKARAETEDRLTMLVQPSVFPMECEGTESKAEKQSKTTKTTLDPSPLEKTLSPSSERRLLFTPHTVTPPPV